MGIGIQLSGIPELESMFARLKAAGQRPKPLLDAVGQAMQTRINLRFRTKTAPDGTKWADLKPSTREQYARQDSQTGNGLRSGTLLVRTGLMRDSLTREPLTNSVTVGFSRPYAAYHESGTKHMARRAIIFQDHETGSGTLSESDRTAILKIAQLHLKKATDK